MAKLTISESAAAVLRQIREQSSGRLTISIDGCCCEGTAPHLYENYLLPYGVHEIGVAEGIPVYVPQHLEDSYEQAVVRIDVVDDETSDAMSLETALGKRLVLRHE